MGYRTSPVSADPELLPDRPRHRDSDNYGFADGHAEWINRKKLPDGTWAKEPDPRFDYDRVIWEPVLKESEGEELAAPDP